MQPRRREESTVKQVWTKLGLAFIAVALVVAETGRAKADVSPTGLGIGADVVLASGQMVSGGGNNLGVGGLAFTYWLSDALALNFIANAGFTAIDRDDLLVRLGFAGGLFFVLLRGDATTLQLGGRLGVGADLWSGGRSVAVLGIDVPLRIEHWLDRHFAVNGQVGISVGVAPREGERVPFSMGIGTYTAWAGVGFTYYIEPASGVGSNGAAASARPQGSGRERSGSSSGSYAPAAGSTPIDPEQGGTGW